MAGSMLLVHSPLLGPSVMKPLAAEARSRGYRVAVPDLATVEERPPPFWKRFVAAALDGAVDIPPPVLLIGHSGAGVYLPQICVRLGRLVEATVFLDAVLPPEQGRHKTSRELMELLEQKTAAGRLLPWIDWWPPDVVQRVLPDSRDQDFVRADMPRVDPIIYEEDVPVPPGWSQRPCGYLRSSPAYADESTEARERGWPRMSIDGTHLSLFTEPAFVFEAVRALVEGMTGPGHQGSSTGWGGSGDRRVGP